MVGSVGGSTNRLSFDLSSISSTQQHAAIFKKLDANSDGKIDESELGAVVSGKGKGKDAAAIMKEVDANGDGAIDSTENDAFLSKAESQRGSKTRPPGPPPSGGGPHGAKSGGSSESSSAIFDKLDTNKDGKVSLQELMAAATDENTSTDVQDLLKSMDTDSDGSISKGELDTFLTKLEQELTALRQSPQTYSSDGTGTADGLGKSVDTIV